MSALIEAAEPGQKFNFAQALSRGTAPTCPGRSDSPLEPIGDTYLGDGSTQLAAALQRRYPALKIKALYSGNPNAGGALEHTVAYDPQTGQAHDARGSFRSTAQAFDGYGAGADRTVTRDEAPATAIDPDADAYVQRNWGPYEDGSGQFGNLDAAPSPDGSELDALLGGEPSAPATARVLDESALTLLEAIWNEKTHPRWPPGSHDAQGHKIAGEFMRVGQRFDLHGHEWEIAHISDDGKIIAHEASGNVSQAETRVFDTHPVGDVAHSLPGATPSAPRILRGGFKSGTKTVITNENSLVVDADRHSETHDPSIPPNPLSKLTPEQWSHFGLVDQLYYNSVMEHFGAWEVNGQKPKPISSSGSQWGTKLAALTQGAPPDAVSTFNKEVSSLKGATRGNQLSGVGVFKGLSNDPVALAAAQAKYARFKEYEGDVNALLAWDLYNRLGEPDMTVIHRAQGNEVFKKALNGDTSVLSGLSTSWKTGSWPEPNSFVFAMPVRQVAFFETLLGQGWGAGSGESELANADRLKVGKLAGYYQSHEVANSDYSSSGGQAGKMFKWLTGQLNKNGHGGTLAGMLKKHFNKDDPYTVDLGPVDANFKVTKKAGEKTYFIPPDSVMSSIEDSLSANPGHPAWDAQKTVADMPEDMKPKPGMIIEKGAQQAGTRYLVIQNDSLGPNQIQYVPLLTGTSDYDVNPSGGGYKTDKAKVILGDDGKPLFFPLPPPPQDQIWSHDMASLAPSGPTMAIGQMHVGDDVAINNDHWKITKTTGSLITLQSLSDGSEGTVESLWKTQKLYPTGQGVPDTGPTAAPPAPSFKPEVGKTALYHLFAGDQLVSIESVNPDDTTKYGEHGSVDIKLPNGSTKTVGAIALTEAPTLPKLTPQKGDTFEANGIKHTVTNVMKDGTVSARPFVPGGPTQKVTQFHPTAADLASLVRPSDYQHGEKVKLGSMAPGALVSGSPSVVRPYMVLGTTGTKTHLKNLDTGEVTAVSKNKSYPTLTSKHALPATTAHDQWVTGEKVNVSDLQPGDKFQLPGGQELTLTGEATQQGQVGWQYESSTGTTGWIPKNLGEPQGLYATYLGKGEPTTPAPQVVEPSTLMDAVSNGEMEPFYTKGTVQNPHAQISNLPEGQHFTDQNGKLWKVKQQGESPIITDGKTLYTVKGTYHGKPSTATLDDQTPSVGPSFAKPTPEPAADLWLNSSNQSLAELKLQPGDKIDTHGHVWTIQSGSTAEGYTATADDAALTKTFNTFVVPTHYQKAEPTAEPSAPGLPSFLGTHVSGAEKAAAHYFDPNELAQRDDGTLVYRKHSIQHGDTWAEVGGHEVNVPDDEKLLPVTLSPSIPSAGAIQHTGQNMDVHDMPVGQTFFVSGKPWILLGHGPAGATAKNLETGTILDAPAAQHGQFELGDWRPGKPVEQQPLTAPLSVGEEKPTGAGTTAGLGMHPAMSLVKGHHMKIKTPGAEYEVLETPKPGDKTIKVQTLKGKKVYDWAHYNKTIEITKEAPAPADGEMKPNPGDSMTELGLQKGDFFGEGGIKHKITSVTPQGIQAEDQNGITTTVHKDFVPETYLKTSPAKQVDANGAPLEPGDPVTYVGSGGYTYAGPDPSDPSVATLHDDLGGGMTTTASLAWVEKGTPLPEPPPPSAPLTPTPATFGELNVGDKYKITGYGEEWEVTGKTPTIVTVKGSSHPDAAQLPASIKMGAGELTYKAPAPAGGNAAGELGGTPGTGDMPIDPYLWHKGGGGQTYAPLNKLQPGEMFSDKSGAKYTVIKHNPKKLEDPAATTTVQKMDGGGTFEVPQRFVNDKGKTIPTRVYKLQSTAPVPEFIAAEPEKPEIPGALTGQQANNVLTSAVTAGGVHVENGWGVFPFAGKFSVTAPDGTTHTQLTHDQAHAWMVHGNEPGPTVPNEKPWSELRVGDLIKVGSGIEFKITADHGNHWEITSPKDGSVTDVPKTSTMKVEVTGHESQKPSWAKLRIGDQIGIGANPAAATHKITADLGDQWEVTHTAGGNPSKVNKTATGQVTVFGHESQKPSVASDVAKTYLQGLGPGKWVENWGLSNYGGNKVWTYGKGEDKIAVGYMDPNGGVHLTPTTFKSEIADVVNAIKDLHPNYMLASSHDALEQQSGFVKSPTKVSPHEMGVGDVFANPNGGHFQIVSKNLVGTLHFKKLSGQGGDEGDLHPDTPMKYTLVSKATATPPKAEVDAIPNTATDSAHNDAVSTADKWMLAHDVPSKTANWIHGQAADYKQQNPGTTWGDAYKATTPPVANAPVQSLKDALDQQAVPAEPVIEKTPPAAPTPAAGEMPDYTGTDLTPLGSAGGTTGAQLATDPTGKQWLIKSYAGNQDRVATELLANSVYRAVGLKAADAGTLVQNGQTKLAYPLVDGQTKNWSGTDQAKMHALGQGVMTDALVGNWDFAGLEDDNVLWNGNDPTRIDQGGTFLYRAQGKPKPFGPVPVEVKSLLSGGGQGVKGVSVSEDSLRQQAKEIASKLPAEKIDELVNAAPFADQQMKDHIRANLKSRVAWMAQFANGAHSDMLDGVKLAPSPATEPVDADVTPVTHSTAELDYPGPPSLGLAAAKDKIGDAVSSPGQIVDLGNGASVVVRANDKGFRFKASDGKRYSVEAGKLILAIKVARAISKSSQPQPQSSAPEPPSYAAKYQVGHQVSYAVPGGGTKTSTITQDVSPSSTQHAYLMLNGDTAHEDSIGGLAPNEPPQPKPQWNPEPTGTPSAPHAEDMPIEPYLWHKGGGGQSYKPISTLKPGTEFTDKKGDKYIVISASAGVTVAEPIGTPGASISIPHSFIAKSGKVHPTRVSAS